MTRIAGVFPKLRTSNNKLDQCWITFVSENPMKNKMVNGLKDCWNMNDSTFTIFIDNCEGILAAKSHF